MTAEIIELKLKGTINMTIKVGDNVEHQVYGKGIVDFISPNELAKAPVKVHFLKRKTYAYFTVDGYEYKGGPLKLKHSPYRRTS